MSYVQRETPVLAQLCELLVKKQYGELAARVFSVLARSGRQTFAGLSRASYLNSRQVRYGLIILSQQHLVFNSTPADSGVISYEIDWQQSYAVVRHGRAISAVEKRFGTKAANVISNLLTLGDTRMKDLRQAYFPSTDHDSDIESDDGHAKGNLNGSKGTGSVSVVNGVTNGHLEGLDNVPEVHDPVHINGVNGSKKRKHTEDVVADEEQESQSIDSIVELDSIIHHLMVQGWLIKFDANQLLGPGDFHALARERAIQKVNNGVTPTGTKDKDRVTIATLEQKREIRDEWLELPRIHKRKRKATDPDLERSSKRLRVAGDNSWSIPRGEVVVLDEDFTVRVNPEKFVVAMRTDMLVALVESRLGYSTGKVYETLLRLLERQLARCFEEWPDPTPADPEAALGRELDPRLLVTAREIAKAIDPHVNVLEGLDPHAIVHLAHGHAHVDKHLRISPPIDPFNLHLEEKTKFVDKHIKYLSDDPFHFVTWHSRNGYSEWHVEFEEIAKSMIQHEIENTIAAGTEKDRKYGVKLIRALLKKGKLDERQMSNVMMMPAPEIRSVVNTLTYRGFVQTQEIPKVERREAKHSIHLIWYDRQRSRERLLHDTYQAMTRILQRMTSEQEKVQELLSKAERSDVIGNEQKWLSQHELDALRKFKDVQTQLGLQLFREDELVATLRDFIGPLVSA